MAQIPLINPVQEVFAGSTNLFAGEIAPAGDVLLFSTLLGGPGNDSLQSIGVDSGGNIIIVGQAGDAFGDGFSIFGVFGDGFEFPMVNADSQPFGNGTEPFNGSSGIGQQRLTFLARLNQTAGVSFSVPSKIDFTGSAPQVAGQTYPIAAPIQIGNYGTTNVQISSIDVSGDFTGTNDCPAVLTAGSTTTLCSISLVFAPTASGIRSGAITIHDDAPGNPHVISLVNATASSGASLTISPLSLTFPSQQMGTTSPAQVITLQNLSTAPLSITHIVAAGDFSEVTTCTATLTGSCTISVTFTPTSSGSRSGTITITDSAADSPQVVTLSGNGGTSPALTPAALIAALMAVVETLTIMVLLLEPAIMRLVGLIVQVASCGAPAHVKLTVPLNPEGVNV